MKRLLPYLVTTACLAACEQKTTEAPPPKTEPAVPVAPSGGRLPKGVRPKHYTLELTIRPEHDDFSGHAQIQVELDAAVPAIFLHAKGLDVRSASVSAAGVYTKARLENVGDDGLAKLSFDHAVGPGAATVELTWTAPFDTEGSDGVFRVEEEGRRYVFTQFEATLARRAFPSFDDPMFKTPFDLSLVIAAEHVAVANTAEMDRTPSGAGLVRVRFLTSEPLPTYLVAFAVGPLDIVDAAPLPPAAGRDHPVPIRGVAAKGKGPRLAFALEQAPKMIAILEREIGVPFPFRKLDLIAVPGFIGAMENAGAITFREWYLMLDGARAPTDQREGYATIMAHELAHHWFGDLVTMPWWDDLWLNEAFASWMEYRAADVFEPRHRLMVTELEDRAWAYSADGLASSRQIRQPIESNDDITNAFDSITYTKGAAVLFMFERFVGRDVFRKSISRYLEAHRFGSATTEDFLAALSLESGRDLAPAFTSFLRQSGMPRVDLASRCEGADTIVSLSQTRHLPLGSKAEADRRWIVPVCLRYPAGAELKEQCLLLAEAKQEERITGTCAPWIFPNADGAGYYLFGLAAKDLASLIAAQKQLSARERLALAQSVHAGVEAGRITAADALAVLAPFATATERAVAVAPMELIALSKDRWADAETTPAIEAYARSLYAGVIAGRKRAPRADDDPERAVLIESALEHAALVGRDKAIRAELAALGRAVVAPKGKKQPDPNVLELALSVAVQDSDVRFFDQLATLAKNSSDAAFRRPAIKALGHADSPALGAHARELLLDPALRSDDVLYFMSAHVSDPKSAEPAWAWLKLNFDALAKRMPEDFVVELFTWPASLCTEADKKDVEAFFASRITAIPGAPRQLATTLESIELCIASRAAHSESARVFFRAQKPTR